MKKTFGWGAIIVTAIIAFYVGNYAAFHGSQGINAKLTYQGKSASEWGNLYSTQSKELTKANQCIVDPTINGCFPFADAVSKQTGIERSCDQAVKNSGDIVWHYKNCPSPTPEIIYKTNTQYVPQYTQQPTQPQNTSSTCRSDYAGGMYCTSGSGVQTHCTSNYAGGYNCN